VVDFRKIAWDRSNQLKCPRCKKFRRVLLVMESGELLCEACLTGVKEPKQAPKPGSSKGKVCSRCGGDVSLFMGLETGLLICEACLEPGEQAESAPFILQGQDAEKCSSKPWHRWVYGSEPDPALDRHHKSSQPHAVDRPDSPVSLVQVCPGLGQEPR